MSDFIRRTHSECPLCGLRVADVKCLCCKRRLCGEHLNQHIQEQRHSAESSIQRLEELRQQLLETKGQFSMQRQHLEYTDRNVGQLFAEMRRELDRKEEEAKQQIRDINRGLEKNIGDLESAVAAVNDLSDELESSLSSPVVDEKLVSQKSQAENLLRGVTLPELPNTARMTKRPEAVLRGFVELLDDLKVDCPPSRLTRADDWGVDFKDEKEDTPFQPKVARVWRPRGDFCLRDGVVVARRGQDGEQELDERVMLACSGCRILLLTVGRDGSERLGELQVNSGLKIFWFDLSPCHRRMAVVTDSWPRHVLVCNMSGRVSQRLPEVDNVISVSISARRLLVVDSGDCEAGIFGCVQVWTDESQSQEFQLSFRIPLDDGAPGVFPTAAVDASGGIFVLTYDSPADSSLLVYNAEGAQHDLAIHLTGAPQFLCCDASGKVYVGDVQDRSVSVFAPDGSRLAVFDDLDVQSCHGLSVWDEAETSKLVVSDQMGRKVHIVSLRSRSAHS